MGVINSILRGRRFKAVFAGSAISYWLLYAFSSGIIFYYSFPVTNLGHINNPYFASINPYWSGLVWFPTSNVQLNLFYGPTAFSIVLSTLFGLNISLLVFNIISRKIGKVQAINLVGLIPALVSGGCCAFPLGAAFLVLFIPLSVLSIFIYDYVGVLNYIFALIMAGTIVYSARRLRSCCSLPVKAH